MKALFIAMILGAPTLASASDVYLKVGESILASNADGPSDRIVCGQTRNYCVCTDIGVTYVLEKYDGDGQFRERIQTMLTLKNCERLRRELPACSQD